MLPQYGQFTIPIIPWNGKCFRQNGHRQKIKKYITNKKELLVPYNSINNNGLLRCIKVLKIEIDNKEYKNVLVGLSMNNISIDGIDCILNNKLLEDEQW